MNITIEAGALTIFWGSFLANLLWTNRETIRTTARKCAERAASFVIRKTKKIFKVAKPSQQNSAQSTPRQEGEEERINQKLLQEGKRQEQKNQEPVEQKRKDKRKVKKHKNLRKYTKNYEDWMLRRAYLRKIDQRSTSQFSQQLKRIGERKWSDQIKLNKHKDEEKIEDIEKYVEEQLDIEELDEMDCILPYDPFVSQQQEQASL